MPYVITEQCIQCGACVAGCPTGAAKEGESQNYIDVSICIECGTCEQNCPVMAIIFVEGTEESAPRAKS